MLQLSSSFESAAIEAAYQKSSLATSAKTLGRPSAKLSLLNIILFLLDTSNALVTYLLVFNLHIHRIVFILEEGGIIG